MDDEMQIKRDRAQIAKAHKSIMRYIAGIKGPGLEKFSEITSHIFICNWKNAIKPEQIREYRISAIIGIDKREKPDGVIKSYKRRKIQEFNIPPNDKILQYLEPTYNFIHNFVVQDKKIL